MAIESTSPSAGSSSGREHGGQLLLERAEDLLGHLARTAPRRCAPSRSARSSSSRSGRSWQRVPVELQPLRPLLDRVERFGVLGVDVLQRPRTGGVGLNEYRSEESCIASDRLDVHQQQDVGGLAAGVGQVGELAGRELEARADLVVECSLEGAPTLVLRELDQSSNVRPTAIR